MDTRKAHALVDSILNTHAEAVGVDTRVAQVFHNARLDLHGLVGQIIEECRTETLNERRGNRSRDDNFDAHADEAVDITREP